MSADERSVDEGPRMVSLGKHFSRMASLHPSRKPVREKDAEAEEERASWYRDELKVGGKDRKKALKKLYRQKIAAICLRRSGFRDRALAFHFRYPPEVLEAYKALGKAVHGLPAEDSPAFRELVERDDNRVGVVLAVPDAGSLAKLGPRLFLQRFSVPFAKVGKTYKTIKHLMKDNGFVLTQSSKYNFCWGFSKHRKEVYVVAAHPGPGRLPAFLPLFRLLAGGQERLSVDQPQQKTKNAPQALRLHPPHLRPQNRL